MILIMGVRAYVEALATLVLACRNGHVASHPVEARGGRRALAVGGSAVGGRRVGGRGRGRRSAAAGRFLSRIVPFPCLSGAKCTQVNGAALAEQAGGRDRDQNGGRSAPISDTT